MISPKFIISGQAYGDVKRGGIREQSNYVPTPMPNRSDVDVTYKPSFLRILPEKKYKNLTAYVPLTLLSLLFLPQDRLS